MAAPCGPRGLVCSPRWSRHPHSPLGQTLAGNRQRSSFLTQAAERELMRLRQLKALDQLVPWDEGKHPELKQGAAKWISKLRQQDEQRFTKLTSS